jgi:hypothetical protein
MRTRAALLAVALFATSAAVAQEVAEPPLLQEALDDIGYADLLNAAQLAAEQLGALHDLQIQLRANALVGPEVAQVLAQLLTAVLSGTSLQEAHAALGQEMQPLQQAQQAWQESLQRYSGDLLGKLTAEQRDALVWFGSPAHALDGLVYMVTRARPAPDAQWQQMKQQVSQAMAPMLSQMDPQGGATPETVAQLLEAARALDEATFEAKRATLAREWLPKLMPTVAQRLADPQFQEQQLGQVAQRLVAYPRGAALVQAKLEAGGGQ